MLILGIETSCDETGLALYDTERGLLSEALHSQIAMHNAYGGVVPELASRDHIERVVPLTQTVLHTAGKTLGDLDLIAYTGGPGLAGALLVGAAIAEGLGAALGIPTLPIHHLEGHLLSPLLADPAPSLPFVALLVSGGHSQLLAVHALGRYTLLGETVDDAAGEAFDKTAKLMGLPYPGGPALAKLALEGRPLRFSLPRPMLHTEQLDMSFSGLKTAVSLLVKECSRDDYPDIAAEFQEAITDVLVHKSLRALKQSGLDQLVVAGGVGANQRLRQKLKDSGARVFFPPLQFCTDNGVMIAHAAAVRVSALQGLPALTSGAFEARPRWPLSQLTAI